MKILDPAANGRLTVPLRRHGPPASLHSALGGKRVAMVLFSHYPADPRPRRAAEALVHEGMRVEVICLKQAARDPRRDTVHGVDIARVPLERRRGGVLGYVFQYSAFLLVSALILAARSLTRRYDLVYVHNMPDVLVLTALIPKVLGAKVILDLHDPMPELMMTIFGLAPGAPAVRLLKRLEKWSIGPADLVLTVNRACKDLFASRSCRPEKVRVVMNSPDERIFPFRPAGRQAARDRRPTEPFVIMYHGSIVERNGLDLAVDALVRLRESVPTAVLRIYGSATPFLDHVMESATARGVDHLVHYLGPKSADDIATAIEGCDVGIIPNHRNVFTELNTPTRIFEYLALGKPVIAPRAAGIEDYFDSRSLLFFDLGDGYDLARKIEYVFFHRREALDIAGRGQQIYLAHAWQEEKQTLVTLVAELLGAGRGPAPHN